MARTRRDRRVERKAALRSLFWAGVMAAVALAVLRSRSGLEHLAADIAISDRFQARIVTIGALVAAGAGALYLMAAVGRGARWFVAVRQQRMLSDPERAALVPPSAAHLQLLQAPPRLPSAVGWSLAGAALTVIEIASSGKAVPALGLITLLCYAGAVLELARWRAASRAERMSEDPALATETVVASPARRTNLVPPLKVSLYSPEPDPELRLMQLTPQTNIFGRPPWNIAYLRLFNNEDRLKAFCASAWREFGYVHYIRAASSVSRAELKAAKQGQPVFITSHAVLFGVLEHEPTDPVPDGDSKRSRREVIRERALTAAGRAPSTRYLYPTRALLCHETFWKATLDVLLERMDVVVLDLCGYRRKNAGTGYEMQRVIDRFPIENCLLVGDEHSDLTFLEAQVRQAWAQMTDGSPNSGGRTRTVLVARTGHRVGQGTAAVHYGRSETLAVGAAIQRQRDRADAS